MIAVVGILAAISAIVLGLTPPSGYTSTPVPVYAAIVATGVLVLGIPPQFIYRFRGPRGRRRRGDRGAGGGRLTH